MIEKVLFTCLYPPALDGSAYSNSDFVQGLSDLGISVQVVAQPCQGDNTYDALAKKQHGIDIYRLPVALPYEGSAPSQHQLETITHYLDALLRRQEQEHNLPDLVVTGHDSWAWYNNLYKQFNLPIVQHLRGTPTRAIMQGIYSPEDTKQYLDAVFQADEIVTVSQHFANLVTNLGYPEQQTHAIYNGINLSLFEDFTNYALKESLGIPESSPVLVHTSNFYPVKRVGDIVSSANQVLAKHPQAHYLFIGEGPEFSAVKQQANSLHYSDNFHFVGRIPKHQVADYLNVGDIFILSSENEGLPRATVEAQACGLYLIMSDCPAGVERTQNGNMGALYEMGNPDDLAQKTIAALEMGGPARDILTRQARDYIHAHFDVGKQLLSYVAVLNDVHTERKLYHAHAVDELLPLAKSYEITQKSA